METDGRLSQENLTAILAASPPSSETASDSPAGLYDRMSQHLPDLFESTAAEHNPRPHDGDQVFWYREWSAVTKDYLERHVRLVARTPPGSGEDMFDGVLKDHSGMVLTIRRAFELLRPRGLTLLRRWPDGDDIDLPALLAAVTERRAGHTPSDRLYIKRAKQVRDVAVLLLVDLSGSTKNIVPGTDTSVLTVEKEAIVLFCEALRVVGDDFAVAGFSGRGRLQVDYFRYKNFDEPVNRKVRRRISGMAPQRSTRTGAALRHGVHVLSQNPSKTRLLLLLSDGYPNDTGYKRDAAIADVQKAVTEAKSRGIHIRPITVNLTAEKNLDNLYGSLHHNVISDIRQLPDTLWRIYCTLTR
jgi:nitric oxide reductase activation protein